MNSISTTEIVRYLSIRLGNGLAQNKYQIIVKISVENEEKYLQVRGRNPLLALQSFQMFTSSSSSSSSLLLTRLFFHIKHVKLHLLNTVTFSGFQSSPGALKATELGSTC